MTKRMLNDNKTLLNFKCSYIFNLIRSFSSHHIHATINLGLRLSIATSGVEVGRDGE